MCDGSYIPGYDSKSQVGYNLFMNLNSGTYCARSFGTNSIDRSAMDTEVCAIDACIVELLWHRALLAELGFPQNDPSIIWTVIVNQQRHYLKSSRFQIDLLILLCDSTSFTKNF